MSTNIKQKLENLFKHKYVFNISDRSIDFQWSETGKIKTNINKFLDGVFPYLLYLQSLAKVKTGPKSILVKNEYIICFAKQYDSKWIPEENCYFNRYYYKNNKFKNWPITSYDEEKQSTDYIYRIKVWGSNYFKYDYGDDVIFKIDNCVICLSEPSAILYIPCKHQCICEDCNNEKELKSCPYCRVKIEKRVNTK